MPYSENNKIKFMNGKTFATLKKLTRVYLEGNVCINKTLIEEIIDFDCGKVLLGPYHPNNDADSTKNMENFNNKATITTIILSTIIIVVAGIIIISLILFAIIKNKKRRYIVTPIVEIPLQPY